MNHSDVEAKICLVKIIGYLEHLSDFVSGFKVYYSLKFSKKYFTNCVSNVIACCNI